jgi:dephospho-CoA kinase
MEHHSEAIHLDIDKVGHYVLTLDEVKEELVNTFGPNVINENLVDRKKLGEIVFNSRERMDRLTDITWKYMQIEIDKFLEANKDKKVILDWLLLANTRYFDMCDLKILLDIPYEIRKHRAMLRDNITEEAFQLREKASIDYDADKFDHVIRGDQEIEVGKLVKSL